MSTTTTSTSFDFGRFVRAIEERDASTLLSAYRPDATVKIVDRISPPSSPRVLSDTGQIKDWLEDLNGRDMTHAVIHQVADDRAAAYTVACSYPDGTRVLCAAALKLSDGLIASQTIVQVWDGALGQGASA